jgi:hypothetical protein
MRRAEAGTDRSRSWWLEYLTGMLNVTVRDGTVDLWGFVASDDEKKGNPNRRGEHTRRQDDQRSFDHSATRDCNGVTAHRSHRRLKSVLVHSI